MVGKKPPGAAAASGNPGINEGGCADVGCCCGNGGGGIDVGGSVVKLDDDDLLPICC